jgi:hypothetical protein
VGFYFIRVTARMLNIAQGKLRVTNQGEVMKDVIKAEVTTPGGIQGDVILLDSATIFRLAFTYNPELALKMGEAGAAVYMLKQAGYQVKVVEKPVDNLAEWHKERIAGIVERRSLTDMIKLLIQYAEADGSTNAYRYYSHFSNLVNKYIILDGTKKAMSKIKDKRNRMSKDQLRNVATFENMFIKLIGGGMTQGDGYKKIYDDCKARASAIAAVLDIEPLPLLPKSNRKLIEDKLDKSLPAES